MARTTDPAVSRRSVLGATLGAGLGVTTAGAASAQESSLSEWFSNTSNYDGVVDETGKSEVTVSVGVDANGGAYGFGPAAIRVDPGTTVTWEWTGEGSMHNVVAKDGSFKSTLTDEAGHTFSQTFDEPAAVPYYCGPHKAMGMKGAILVGSAATVGSATATADPTTATETTAAPAPEDSGGDDGIWFMIGGGVGAVLSPLVFALFLLLRDEESAEPNQSVRTDGGESDG